MAMNLYEYYTGLGQTLPSVQERSKTYEQQGLGSASTYIGSLEQNTALLSKLQAVPLATAPTGGLPSNTSLPIIPDTQTQAPDLTGVNAEIASQRASLDAMMKQHTEGITTPTTPYQESQKG